MFYMKLFLFGSLISISLSAANLCNSHSTACKCVLDNGDSIDLSTVGLHEFPKFYELVGPKPSENDTDLYYSLYSYNPCFAFNYPDAHINSSNNAPCSGVAACQKTPGGSEGQLPYLYSLGLQNDASFYHDGNDTKIVYKYPGNSSMLTVKMQCINDGIHSLSVDSVDHFGNTTMTLSGNCACLNACKSPVAKESSTLSTGSILLITFFSILLIYLAFGIVWNLCNGAKGTEILPNIEFWNDLPKLISEGLAFSCSCCTRRSTYGDV